MVIVIIFILQIWSIIIPIWLDNKFIIEYNIIIDDLFTIIKIMFNKFLFLLADLFLFETDNNVNL